MANRQKDPASLEAKAAAKLQQASDLERDSSGSWRCRARRRQSAQRLRATASSHQRALERVQSLLSKSTKNAKWTNCRLVLSHRSQFFHSLLFLSSQAKLRSTTQRLGITLKV